MQKLTVSFILPSGVPITCTELYGEHYEILTSSKGKGEDTMNKFILSLIVSVGSVILKHTPEHNRANMAFVTSMRSTDKQHILATVRQASMDFEKTFEFPYKWVDSQGHNIDSPQSVALNDMESDYTLQHIEKLKALYGDSEQLIQFYRELNKDGTFCTTPSIHRAEEYADLQQTYEVSLPKTKQIVSLSYLTGKGELFLANKKKEMLSTNSIIEARFPTVGGVRLNMGSLPMKDIECLRSKIMEHEGNVEMELRFENPNTESSDKYVTVQLISETAFFFPSGALG